MTVCSNNIHGLLKKGMCTTAADILILRSQYEMSIVNFSETEKKIHFYHMISIEGDQRSQSILHTRSHRVKVGSLFVLNPTE